MALGWAFDKEGAVATFKRGTGVIRCGRSSTPALPEPADRGRAGLCLLATCLAGEPEPRAGPGQRGRQNIR